jgi:hypothetical protein
MSSLPSSLSLNPILSGRVVKRDCIAYRDDVEVAWLADVYIFGSDKDSKPVFITREIAIIQ